MRLTQTERQSKLTKLCEIEGYDTVEALLHACILDTVAPAICVSGDCSYTCEMEPDQRHGWCEECGSNTMMAAPVLAGII